MTDDDDNAQLKAKIARLRALLARTTDERTIRTMQDFIAELEQRLHMAD